MPTGGRGTVVLAFSNHRGRASADFRCCLLRWGGRSLWGKLLLEQFGKLQWLHITVDSAQTRNVREFLEENGASWEEVYPETENALPPSEVVYLVTATVSNESNEDGMVQFSNFVMTSGSILLQLDGTLNNYSAPELANAGSFVLPVGKSRTFTFAFTPDSATVAADAKSLYQRMKTSEFYLCISLVPERRLIRMPQNTV